MTTKTPIQPDIYQLRGALETLPIIKAYMAFTALPAVEKRRVWGAWDQYYQDVKQTASYLIHQEIRREFVKKNMGKMKELLKELERMIAAGAIPELEKPKALDPEEFFHHQKVLQYKAIINQIEREEARKKDGLDF